MSSHNIIFCFWGSFPRKTNSLNLSGFKINTNYHRFKVINIPAIITKGKHRYLHHLLTVQFRGHFVLAELTWSCSFSISFSSLRVVTWPCSEMSWSGCASSTKTSNFTKGGWNNSRKTQSNKTVIYFWRACCCSLNPSSDQHLHWKKMHHKG